MYWGMLWHIIDNLDRDAVGVWIDSTQKIWRQRCGRFKDPKDTVVSKDPHRGAEPFKDPKATVVSKDPHRGAEPFQRSKSNEWPQFDIFTKP